MVQSPVEGLPVDEVDRCIRLVSVSRDDVLYCVGNTQSLAMARNEDRVIGNTIFEEFSGWLAIRKGEHSPHNSWRRVFGNALILWYISQHHI
jgi:hypothetical protein